MRERLNQARTCAYCNPLLMLVSFVSGITVRGFLINENALLLECQDYAQHPALQPRLS